MDWVSRYVLSWELSTTLEVDFCIRALERALSLTFPEVFNSDQGSQFTSLDFIKKLQERNIAISMDGRGRAMDNVFTERLWRSVKYGEVYLNDYQTVQEAKEGISRYLDFYMIRNHQSKTDVTTKVRLWEHPKQDCVTFKIRQFIDGTPGASVCL